MIQTEFYKTRKDGTVLIRSYSDVGYKIERDGDRYDEAIDPDGYHREYIETNEPIDLEQEETEVNEYE